MADIIGFLKRYKHECETERSEPNKYIVKMMERDLPGAERNVVKDPLAKLQELDAANSEFRDVIDLYLAGNYKEMTLTRLIDEDVAPLCRTLGPSDAIVTLDLRYNCITDTGAAYIAKMLEENVCLKSLNLMHNDFGSEGARLIANALETNSTLEMLRVNGNKIGDVGGLWFAQMLQVNETLEYLDLGDTDLRIESLIAFATVLLRNTSLKALNVNRPLLFTRGSGGVGKSALTVQFVQGIFVEKYDPTIEDSYRKMVEVDGRQGMLEILDTAGTEQFTAMRDLYMKNGQGFLLVYSITAQATFNDLHDLRAQILRVKDAEEVPMILVGNKSDLETDRMVAKEQGSGLAYSWGCKFMETSAKNKVNVNEVFCDLVRQIYRSNPDVQRGRNKKRKCTIL